MKNKEETKSVVLSKTLIVNILTLIVLIITWLVDNTAVEDNAPWVLTVILVLNTVLRLVTRLPVSFKLPIFTLVLALALVPTAAIYAQTATITGPDKSEPGEVVILDASKSEGDTFIWHQLDYEGVFFEGKNNQVLVQPKKTGVYTFAFQATTDGPDAIAFHTLTVAPIKPIVPVPVVLPKVARLIYDAAIKQNDPETAQLLADIFLNQATVAAADASTTPTQIVTNTSEQIKALVPAADLEAWRPWQEVYKKTIADEYDTTVKSQLIEAWNQVAEGLTAAAR